MKTIIYDGNDTPCSRAGSLCTRPLSKTTSWSSLLNHAHPFLPSPGLSLFKPTARVSVLKRIHSHWTFFFPTVNKDLSLLLRITLPKVYSDQWLSLAFQGRRTEVYARIPVTRWSLLPGVFSLWSHIFPDDNALSLLWQWSQSPRSLGGSVQTAVLSPELGGALHPLGARGLEIKIVIPPPSNKKISGSKTWRGNFTMEINKILMKCLPNKNLPSTSLTVSFSIRKIFITFQNDVQVRFSHFARIPEPPW